MTAFALHPQLAADTVFVLDGPLSALRLMNDARFPWLILVPRVPDIREIHELAPADQQTLLQEITTVGPALLELVRGQKLNVAALGNVVPQLHVHLVARRSDDAAWPAPVWGRGAATPYPPALLAERVAALRARLGPEPALRPA